MNRAAPAVPPAAAGEHDDVADISALIARLTGEVNEIACEKTKSIQHITNQMKMLALNALIESSRAGAQGAGFAVVAQEVRALAQRSADASREIKTLIQASTGQVREGARLVNQTGDSLTEIVQAVEKVTAIVGEIATASGEQSRGLDEVNIAVGNMDEMTQRNAALVEENTAVTQSMADQAARLAELVRFFRL